MSIPVVQHQGVIGLISDTIDNLNNQVNKVENVLHTAVTRNDINLRDTFALQYSASEFGTKIVTISKMLGTTSKGIDGLAHTQ